MSEENLPEWQLRASDADRDQVARLLSEALAEGRLSVHEHGQRIDRLYAAQTYAALQPLTADLPDRGWSPALDRRHRRAESHIGLFSRTSVRPNRPISDRIQGVALIGGVTIDLRDTQPVGDNIDVGAVAVFSSVDVIVAPETRVTVTGVGIKQPERPGSDNGPAVAVHGVALFGGVKVHRRSRGQQDG